ncbi:HNH endonuclease signature motif containing protein [Paenarthrobacter nicotinovorans]|uniref:HNH endonuclease signature motif containing protein n=1 Tax=Paenarthrobacter nicotinovorans TaxID=29320 RepID=UPI0039A5D4C1
MPPRCLAASESVTDFQGVDVETLALSEHVKRKFWASVEKSADCWNWTGWLDTHGYGTLHLGRKHHRAHRISFAIHGRKLDQTMVLDHLCRNRRCVNPKHLEQVTNVENVMRGVSGPAINATKTHCKEGHELLGLNLYIDTSCANPKRKCRTCMRAASKRYADRKKTVRV